MASNNSDTKEVTKLDIRVFTQPQYLEMHSDPARKQYRFAYRIRIENHSEETVRLLRRYWKITNANGKVDEVEGAGVVGETPTLRPGRIMTTPAAQISKPPSALWKATTPSKSFTNMARFQTRLKSLSQAFG